MALHNYIYSKHQTDVTTNNKIAREHEPRPVYLDVEIDRPGVVVIDAPSKGASVSDTTGVIDHNDHSISDHANQIICDDLPHDHHILRLHDAGSSVDVKGTYEDELAHEGDEEEEDDSSDSDFLRKRAHLYEYHCQRHGNCHNKMNQLYPHPPLHSMIDDVDERHENDSIVIVKPLSDQNEAIPAIQSVQPKTTKWVFVNGKKKKLTSRFSKSGSPKRHTQALWRPGCALTKMDSSNS